MTTFDAYDVHRIGDDPDVFEAFYRDHLNAVHRFVARGSATHTWRRT